MPVVICNTSPIQYLYQADMRYAELSGGAEYNYTSSSTVRHELDAFARRKNADPVIVNGFLRSITTLCRCTDRPRCMQSEGAPP